ncbi:hypothetical protein BO86DRAFT_247435 [Aspergillus japonicus CBS 114.51]|uniref:Uncharacterized protein n=1 Tax=Aspergillus japonicus CBS 114.51 TaxID=1448312 RepID=A0A8T8WLQ6_ASPJA|nr:hypothetical protein BO86DRAFT_247435 [Aspergillus japonicus CBS 114.51]RAH76643.1 hypothetical protein BO86DRAFT_247435 [Aspergillus japonicus CBS 114.51]
MNLFQPWCLSHFLCRFKLSHYLSYRRVSVFFSSLFFFGWLSDDALFFYGRHLLGWLAIVLLPLFVSPGSSYRAKKEALCFLLGCSLSSPHWFPLLLFLSFSISLGRLSDQHFIRLYEFAIMRALNFQCMFHSIQHLCILFISPFFEFSVPRCLCLFIYLYSSIYGSGTTDTFLSLDSGMDKFSILYCRGGCCIE